MGNLLQMSITSGQDTDSRQFTLAASSHRLADETYDANGNRTSGSADGLLLYRTTSLTFRRQSPQTAGQLTTCIPPQALSYGSVSF